MRNLTLLVYFTLIGYTNFAQIKFEKGYIIDRNDQRIDCLIKNIEWQNNPSAITYKLDEYSAILTATVNDIKEFGLNGSSKYISALVAIDRSRNNTDKLSAERNPIFNNEMLFLRVEIEGGATLYAYKESNLERFFYKTDHTEIRQLVYKQYISQYNKILENNQFRQQLIVDLKCESIPEQLFQTIPYKERQLISLFKKYNECIQSPYEINAKPKDILRIILRPGIQFNNVDFEHSVAFGRNDLDHAMNGFRFGINLVNILPFNQKKWGVSFEPALAITRSDITKDLEDFSFTRVVSEVKYHVIELPLGLNHYVYLNEDLKIFLFGSLGLNYVLPSSSYTDFEYLRSVGFETPVAEIEYELSNISSLSLGTGLEFINRFNLELRYQLKRNILRKETAVTADFTSFSVLLGYSIFDN